MRENGKCKIRADTDIGHRRHSIVIIDNEKRDCKIIDVVLIGVHNINAKELEKIEKNKQRNKKNQKKRGTEIGSAETMEQ